MNPKPPIPQPTAPISDSRGIFTAVWYRFLAAIYEAMATTDGPKTVTIPKLTGGGTNGSITYNGHGVVTSSVEPT